MLNHYRNRRLPTLTTFFDVEEVEENLQRNLTLCLTLIP